MRIEEISETALSKVPDTELYNLRLRFVQLYEKFLRIDALNMIGGLTRNEFYKRYILLVSEMRKRRLTTTATTALDIKVFKAAMFGGLDIPKLGDVVIIENYISVGGSFVKNPAEAQDVDIIVRDDENNRDEGLELKLGRLLAKETGKNPHFLYSPKGPHSSYIPLFNLVLRAQDETKRVEIKEGEKLKASLPVEEDEIRKADSKIRLTIIGSGALNSPRKDECLLINYGQERFLIDAGPDIKKDDIGKIDELLVCDPESDFMKDAKRLAKDFKIDPGVKTILREGLMISPFEVEHTNHKTYAYRIKTKDLKIIYAPEFFRFPEKEAKLSDIAILEGSAWSSPITFRGGVGGHAALLETYEKAKKAQIKRTIFTHIGSLVEPHLKEAEELGIEIAEDGQTIDSIEKAALTPGKPFTPLKSRGGYGTFEFSDPDILWTVWAQGYLPEPGIAVETKFDGFRVQLHKWDESIKIISEDAKRDLSSRLPNLRKEIKAIKGSLILDGELIIYVKSKKVERKDMPTYLMAENPPPFESRISVFDCLYRDGETLVENSWSDRQEALSAIFASIDELLLERVKPTLTKSKKQFLAAVASHSGKPFSEGAMCKVQNSTYPLTGQTSEWAKFKNLKEIRAKIVGKEPKEGGGFIYVCEIKGGIPIGKTYATKIEANIGDILEIAVAEVKYDEEEDKFTWDNPIVRSKKPAGTALTTKEQAIAISRQKRTRVAKDGKEFGNITFKVGDKGTGITQIHIMGLSDEEVEKLKGAQSKILIARIDPMRLEQALKQAIGNRGAHLDMRLRRGKENSWQGNEIFIGNISGLSKVKELIEGKRKLRAPWKQSRAEEPKVEAITGPLGWMEAGARKIDFFKPGEVGATANKWGAMIKIDSFNWEIYLADEHAKKIRFTGGRYFNGNYLFAYVPVEQGQKRIWMISKLADDDHEKEQKTPKEKSNFMFKIFKIDKKKQIVGGIVYQPEVTDAQGDYTDAEEIEKAMYKFMEKYGKDPRKIKIEHEGKTKYFPVLECFQPEMDIKKGGKTVPAGSWWMMIKIPDKAIWGLVEKGEITGFSMGGHAKEGK